MSEDLNCLLLVKNICYTIKLCQTLIMLILLKINIVKDFSVIVDNYNRLTFVDHIPFIVHKDMSRASLI